MNRLFLSIVGSFDFHVPFPRTLKEKIENLKISKKSETQKAKRA